MVLNRFSNFMVLKRFFPYWVTLGSLGEKNMGSLNSWGCLMWSYRDDGPTCDIVPTMYPSPLLIHRGSVLDRFIITITIEPIKLVRGRHFHHQPTGMNWSFLNHTQPGKIILGIPWEREMIVQFLAACLAGDMSWSGCSLKDDKVTRCLVRSQTLSHQQYILIYLRS